MIKQIDAVRKKDRIGNKARSLSFLVQNKFRIPKTMVLTEAARIRYGKDPAGLDTWLRSELQAFHDPEKRYAVRSSSELEDDAAYSFAGQFKTIMDIQKLDDIIAAVKDVWKSAQQVEEGEYYQKITQKKVSRGMGVIVQEMVIPCWSGVAFSINPITGLDEIIIEGLEGSGEGLLQKGKNPCRWTYIQGAWKEYENDCTPGSSVLEELVDGIRILRKRCSTEIDIEWAFDGKKLYYLQCRSVTAQQYPVIYSNHISREVLPGMIKPLVWSVNIPLVNRAWIRLLEGLLGPLDIKPEQLSQSFYYRAYFNLGTLGTLFHRMGLPRNSLESLMGRKDPSGKSAFRPSLRTMRYLPRMLLFLISNLTLGRVFRRKIGSLEKDTNELKRKLDEDFSIDQYPYVFRQVMEVSEQAAYLNIIIPLVMQILNRFLKRRMEKRELAYEELDFTVDFPELRDYDPRYMIHLVHELWMNIPEAYRGKVNVYADLANLKGSKEILVFQKEFDRLLNRFGHFSESGNDFSYPTWQEDPAFLLSMVRQGDERKSIRENMPGNRKIKQPMRMRGRTYFNAGKYRLYREMISSEYTRGYGLFRDLFLKTGEHMATAGMISQTEDVFLLTLEEHDRLLKIGDIAIIKSLGQKISKRRLEMADLEDISLPAIIYGEETPPLARPDEKTLHGIPVSPGFFEGEIVVVRGYKDFQKKVEGAILIIPFSDVGWTPVLTRAAAIVSESGGMLSHASIVARELHIPAIASVDHACSLEEGRRARLDGYKGLLILDN